MIAANIGSTAYALLILSAFFWLGGCIADRPWLIRLGGRGVLVSAVGMFFAFVWMVWS